MAICPKCDRYFKKQVIVDGKVKKTPKRKFCFECSPWGQHNTCSLEKWDFTPGEKIRECKCCGKEYPYDRKRRVGHTTTLCATCVGAKRRKELKQKMIDYKGGSCSICGYKKSSHALQFHHLDPSKKEFTIGGSHCVSWEKTKKELDKCILVCANCHAETHEEIFCHIA